MSKIRLNINVVGALSSTYEYSAGTSVLQIIRKLGFSEAEYPKRVLNLFKVLRNGATVTNFGFRPCDGDQLLIEPPTKSAFILHCELAIVPHNVHSSGTAYKLWPNSSIQDLMDALGIDGAIAKSLWIGVHKPEAGGWKRAELDQVIQPGDSVWLREGVKAILEIYEDNKEARSLSEILPKNDAIRSVWMNEFLGKAGIGAVCPTLYAKIKARRADGEKLDVPVTGYVGELFKKLKRNELLLTYDTRSEFVVKQMSEVMSITNDLLQAAQKSILFKTKLDWLAGLDQIVEREVDVPGAEGKVKVVLVPKAIVERWKKSTRTS